VPSDFAGNNYRIGFAVVGQFEKVSGKDGMEIACKIGVTVSLQDNALHMCHIHR